VCALLTRPVREYCTPGSAIGSSDDRRSYVKMRALLPILALVSLFALLGCSQQDLLNKFSTPEDQATAKGYIDRLRAGKLDEIEKALDSSIKTPNTRDTLAKMAALFPNGEPTSIKLVGARIFQSSGSKTVNTTFEYCFAEKWLLANVAVRDRQGTKAVVGFHVNPIPKSLESQNRFGLPGKSALQYAVLVAAIAAVLTTLYSVVVCARTKLPRRKWLWMLFILVGFGKMTVNWTTGEWGIAPFTIQLFSASAFAALYGPWMIAVSLPLGAIAFLLYRRSRFLPKAESKPPEGT
jgi:hypothetical protein